MWTEHVSATTIFAVPTGSSRGRTNEWAGFTNAGRTPFSNNCICCTSPYSLDKSTRPVGHPFGDVAFVERRNGLLNDKVRVLLHELQRGLAGVVPCPVWLGPR